MDGQDGFEIKNKIKNKNSSWSSPQAKFLVRGFEVAQET